MKLFYLLIPLFTISSAILIYKHTGKKSIMNMDLVQFLYAFLISPILFVWSKTILHYLLKQEVTINLTDGVIFLIDTLFSVVFLFLSAFIVIHSLTKSFELKVKQDPLHDLFEHSEYFHLNLSHLAFYIGAFSLFSLVAFVNAFTIIEIPIISPLFYFLLFLAFIVGCMVAISILLTELGVKFDKFMKLLIACFFFFHSLSFFIFDPAFSYQHIIFWVVSIAYLAMILVMLLVDKQKLKFSRLRIIFKP